MGLLQYYAMVAREIVSHRIDRAQLVVLAIFLIGGAPGMMRLPGPVQAWQVASYLGGTVLTVRWIFAHYWLWVAASRLDGAPSPNRSFD